MTEGENTPGSEGGGRFDGDRILIVFLPGLGNAILLTPMLRAIRTTYPDVTVDLLIREPVVEALLADSGYVDNFVFYDRSDSLVADTIERIRVVRELWRRDYDVVFATGWEGLNKESLLVACLPADRKIGYRQDRLHNAVFDDVVAYEASDHEVTRRLQLVATIGAEGPPTPTINVTEDAKAYAAEIVDELGGDILVGIHPGSSDALKFKRWSPDRFAAVADNLSEYYDSDIILFGGANEVELARTVTAHMDEADPLVLTGKTSIQEAVATVGECDVFVSNDSGLMHVAAERGVPVVAVFGPTSVSKNAPVGDAHVVLQRGDDVDDVPTADVVSAVTQILDHPQVGTGSLARWE